MGLCRDSNGVLVIGGWRIRIGLRAADASEAAAAATIRAVAFAEEDARRRRLESVLETILEMRALFNEQTSAGFTEPRFFLRGGPHGLASLSSGATYTNGETQRLPGD